MFQRRLSISAATTIAIILIGGLFILFSWSAGTYFRQAALQSESKSLSRIIEVASNQVLRDIQQQALNLYSVLNDGGIVTQAFHHYQQTGDSESLLASLDDPLVNGVPGVARLKLVKLRIYDPNLKFLLESSHGMEGLESHLPEFILEKARKRTGINRLKGIGGLWLSQQGPLYSILLPIGGLQLEGYIELVLDPVFGLKRVSELTGMPLSIYRADAPPAENDTGIPESGLLAIEYQLIGDDGRPAYRLVGIEDVSQLIKDMHNNQLTTTVGFITITFLILLLILVMLNRGIFIPLKRMMHGIERYRGGELETHITPSGLSELYTLGETFNNMIEQIRHDIKELERHTQIDGLTGLGNRRYFELRLKEEWSRATRQQWPVSVLFIDIDYFKRYNDHYGHLQGDDCLRRVADAIQQAVKRDIDIAARYGGEEFVIMLPDTDLAGAEQVARELQQAIRRLHIEHRGSNVEPFVTLSIGIASHIPQFPEKAEELLHAADTALYQAKERGRNRISKQASA